MRYIDEKFKDDSPEHTVERIKKILSDIGIELHEKWTDSGIENCCSVSVYYNEGYPLQNGKGITPAFARASGYGEFIERLQCGVFFYKFQSVEKNPELDIDYYAPDKRYMTREELIENGEWMDYIIKTYPSLTREKIANQCAMYSYTDDRILTVPYYSIFEDKYVYIPANFIRYVCRSNGICVGNARDEAWIHSLSEIMERHNNIEVLTSGKAVHQISEEVLYSFKTVGKILDKIKESGDFDIKILDYSQGTGFPVVGTRIINTKTHNYLVNVCADPVLEIAIERTLTEIFQGRTLATFQPRHGCDVFSSVDKVNTAENILNQIETGNGVYTAEYFNELPPEEKLPFADNSQKTNAELVKYMLNLYKSFNRPLYVRNLSFLGFNAYRFYMPGFSEVKGKYMVKPVQEFYFGNQAADTLKNIEKASDEALSNLILYENMISEIYSIAYNFPRLSGIPMTNVSGFYLMNLHLAYAARKLKRYDEFMQYLNNAVKTCLDEEDKEYLDSLVRYSKMRHDGLCKEAALTVISKFYSDAALKRLENGLADNSLFKGMLVACSYPECGGCKFKDRCRYNDAKFVIQSAGNEYRKFTDGQNKENFKVEF